MNMTLVYFIILIMTLLYLLMFSFILLLVYYAYILGFVRSEFYPCLGSYKVYHGDYGSLLGDFSVT